MALTLSKSIVDFLSSRPGEKFTTREIAEWVLKTFPQECQEKKNSSYYLKTDTDLIRQLQCEIGGGYSSLQKNNPNLKKTEDRPRQYYYSDQSAQAQVTATETTGLSLTTGETKAKIELRRHIMFQVELKQYLDPALVDGVIALLSIQLRELERSCTQPPESAVFQPKVGAPLQLDQKSEASLVNLLMAVVTVDGLTKNVEIQRVRQYFQESLDYLDEGLQRIDSLVQEAQKTDLEPDLFKLARPFISRPLEERLIIYSACADIAFADDEFVDEEQELLSTLARLFQINEQQVVNLHHTHAQVSQERQQSLDNKIRGQFPLGQTVRLESTEQTLQIAEGKVQEAPAQLPEPSQTQVPESAFSQQKVGKSLQLDQKSEAFLVNLLMAVVTADGLTKNVEIQRVRQYFQESLDYLDEDLQRIDSLVQEALNTDFEPDLFKLAIPFISRSLEERFIIYSACADIAFADDEFADEEQELLSTLARLFQIEEQQAANLHHTHAQVSQERQHLLTRKIQDQFSLEDTVRLTSIKQSLPTAKVQPSVLGESTQPKEIPEPPALGKSKPPEEISEPLPPITAAALAKTVELMAIHLIQKKGRCDPGDVAWLHLWRECTDVTPPDIANLIRRDGPIKRSPSGKFTLTRTLNQRELVEALLFGSLVNCNKPTSIRVMSRVSKEPERAFQLLSKYLRECPAFVNYNYGCGSWFGLVAWGRLGYEETVRQNLGEIKKQLESGGKANLTQFEFSVLLDVANAVKDHVVLELAL